MAGMRRTKGMKMRKRKQLKRGRRRTRNP